MLLILPWLLRSMCTVLLNNVALFWEYFWFDNSFIFLTDLHIKKEGKLINYLSTKWQQPSLDWEVYSKTKNSFFLVIEQFHHLEQTLSSSSLSLSLMVEEFLLSCSFQFTISNIFFCEDDILVFLCSFDYGNLSIDHLLLTMPQTRLLCPWQSSEGLAFTVSFKT